MLKDMQQVVVLRETGSMGKCGVLTTNTRKLEFVSVLEKLMMEKALYISKNVISDNVTETLTVLQKQLGTYRKINSESGKATVFGSAKVTFSGKVTEDGKMRPAVMQDDLCITLQLLAFWSSYVVQRKCKFLDYNRIFGDRDN